MKRPGQKEVLERINSLEKPTVVDIGAYDGKITKMFYEAGAVVYAVEPDPGNYKKLPQTKNIKKHHVAIAQYDGKIDFVVARGKHKNKGQSSTIYHDFLKNKRLSKQKISVPCCTFSTFCRLADIQHIDILKLNCEGAEYAVFDDGLVYDISDMIWVSFHNMFKSHRILARAKLKKSFNLLVAQKKNSGDSWELWERKS